MRVRESPLCQSRRVQERGWRHGRPGMRPTLDPGHPYSPQSRNHPMTSLSQYLDTLASLTRPQKYQIFLTIVYLCMCTRRPEFRKRVHQRYGSAFKKLTSYLHNCQGCNVSLIRFLLKPDREAFPTLTFRSSILDRRARPRSPSIKFLVNLLQGFPTGNIDREAAPRCVVVNAEGRRKVLSRGGQVPQHA